MEFDAEIDAELSALSDFSVEDEESIESADDVDVEENVPQVDYGKVFFFAIGVADYIYIFNEKSHLYGLIIQLKA